MRTTAGAPGTCRVCRKGYLAGDDVWCARGKDAVHMHCFPSSTAHDRGERPAALQGVTRDRLSGEDVRGLDEALLTEAVRHADVSPGRCIGIVVEAVSRQLTVTARLGAIQWLVNDGGSRVTMATELRAMAERLSPLQPRTFDEAREEGARTARLAQAQRSAAANVCNRCMAAMTNGVCRNPRCVSVTPAAPVAPPEPVSAASEEDNATDKRFKLLEVD